MDAGLTLKKAKTLVRQREAVQEQQILLKHGQKEDKSIDFLRQGVPSEGKVPLKNRSQAPAKTPRQMQSKCSQCGRGPHTRQQGPAKDAAACHNCKKRALQCTMFLQGSCRGHHTPTVGCDRLLRCSLPQLCECQAIHNVELYCPTK